MRFTLVRATIIVFLSFFQKKPVVSDKWYHMCLMGATHTLIFFWEILPISIYLPLKLFPHRIYREKDRSNFCCESSSAVLRSTSLNEVHKEFLKVANRLQMFRKKHNVLNVPLFPLRGNNEVLIHSIISFRSAEF